MHGLGPRALGKNGRMVFATSIGAFLVEILLGLLAAMWIVELIVLGILRLILALLRLLAPPKESSMEEVFGPASTEERGASAVSGCTRVSRYRGRSPTDTRDGDGAA